MTAAHAGTVRVVHVITGLGVGGAETMLAKLLEAEGAAGVRRSVAVIALAERGELAARVEATGVPVHALDLRTHGLSGVVALLRLMRDLRPDVVQCWMYHADLLGGLAAMVAAPRARRLWSIRASEMPSPAPLSTRLIIRACAALSWVVPHRVISCATVAARLHRAKGYRASRIVVIPNGFDLSRFAPDPAARASVRDELAVAPETPLIGCIARFDPQKDFPTMLRAFGTLVRGGHAAHLVIAGKGAVPDNGELLALIPDELRSRVHLLGVRNDIPRLTAAFDVATLTSAYGEGFPNVLGEALACGVPCVATDVGDSREIVAADGVVVPIGDADGIARGWAALLQQSREDRLAMSARARLRAVESFDIRMVARRYWAEQDAGVSLVVQRSGASAQDARP